MVLLGNGLSKHSDSFAVRTEKYKYIFNHGVWDINELYDLEMIPYENGHNLIWVHRASKKSQTN